MPYSAPSSSSLSSLSLPDTTATMTLTGPHLSHRRTRSLTSLSDEQGPGAFVSLGSLPKRKPTQKKTMFHFNEEHDQQEEIHDVLVRNPWKTFHPSLFPSLRLDQVEEQFPYSPLLSPLSPTGPLHFQAPVRSPIPVNSSPIILSNGKPLKSSFKSSSSPHISQVTHLRDQSIPTLPNAPKNVHFNKRLESIRFFKQLGKPADISRPTGEESESESETEADLSFPQSLAPPIQIQIDTDRSTTLPNTSNSHANIYVETLSLAKLLPATIHGSILVRNVAFEKQVALRFTIDNWETTSEVLCNYSNSLFHLPSPFPGSRAVGDAIDRLSTGKSSQGYQWDRFSFILRLESYGQKLTECNLSFVGRFTATGVGEWWDNNDGQDYRVFFMRPPATAPSSMEPTPATPSVPVETSVPPFPKISPAIPSPPSLPLPPTSPALSNVSPDSQPDDTSRPPLTERGVFSGGGMGQGGEGTTQQSGSSQTTTQEPTSNENGSPGGEQGGHSNERSPDQDEAPRDDDDRALVPVASTNWPSRIANEILDLTDQVASVALFGPIGVGKTFVARSVLDHERTKAKFGDNRYLMRCDDLANSLEGFTERLFDAIHTNAMQVESRLQSSPPLMLLLDGVDSVLDPLAPDAEGIYARIVEIGSYEHVCLVATSRTYPDIHGFHRVEVTPPPEAGARDIFYSLCNLARSPAVDALIATLDSHPFSIELVARYTRENSWDEQMLLKAWADQKGVLRISYYQSLKDAIEPVFCSPMIEGLGTMARDVLRAIASFQSGIKECQLEGIFRGTGGVGEVIDVLCRSSLVHRRDGVLKMLLPLQFYFLKSMIVYAETEEIIKWGLDCMPAQGVPTTYTQGPPDGWLLHPSPVRPTIHRPKKNWIRRLPKIIKRRFLALFRGQIAPTAQTDSQANTVNISLTPLEEKPANIPSTAEREDCPNIPPTIIQKDLTNIPPTVVQEDLTSMSLSVVQDVPSTPLSAPEKRTPPEMVAYEIDW